MTPNRRTLLAVLDEFDRYASSDGAYRGSPFEAKVRGLLEGAADGDETCCWIRPTPRGDFYWRVCWPNGRNTSGTSASWGAAADEVRERLRLSAYRREDR